MTDQLLAITHQSLSVHCRGVNRQYRRWSAANGIATFGIVANLPPDLKGDAQVPAVIAYLPLTVQLGRLIPFRWPPQPWRC